MRRARTRGWFPGGPTLPVTAGLVRAVAAGNIGVFGGGSLLWLLAAAGLWRRRRAARVLALVLFGALTAVGLFNLLAELVLVALLGSLAAAGGATTVVATVAGTLAGLVLLPLLALLTLARPSSAAAFWLRAPVIPAVSARALASCISSSSTRCSRSSFSWVS